MTLIAELRRRNVFRVAVAYLVLGWVVLEVTSVLAPALLLPDWTVRRVLWMGIAGFPFAVFLAWAFEVTPEGIRREAEVDRSRPITHDCPQAGPVHHRHGAGRFENPPG